MKVSRGTASHVERLPGFEGRYEDLGGYTVGFESYSEDADASPLFKGLPDDRCQCTHWGYVIRGKVTFKTAEGEETFEAGDAYVIPPGHTPVIFAGTEVVEFSPTEELQRTMEVVMRNLESEGAPAG